MKKWIAGFGALMGVLSFTTVVAQATHENITWSASLDIPGGFQDMGLLGSPKLGLVRVFEQKQAKGGGPDYQEVEILLKTVNQDMKVLATYRMNKRTICDNIQTQGFAQMKSAVYWIYSCTEEKITKFYAYKINLKTAKFDGSPLFLMEMEKSQELVTSLSANSSRFLMRYIMREEKGVERKAGIYVFDDKMNKQFGDELLFPFKGDNIGVMQDLVDRNGKVFLLTREEDKRKKDVQMRILKYTSKDSRPDILPIDFIDISPQSFHLMEDIDGNINLMGYYYQKDKAIVGGMYMLRLNGMKLDKLKNGYYEIPEALLLTFETGRAKKKAAKGEQSQLQDNLRTSFLTICEYLTYPDGSVSIIGEARRIFYESGGGDHYGVGPQYFGRHGFEDLLIIHLLPNGELGWIKRIPKIQKSGADVFSDIPSGSCSYKSVLIGNDLYLYYMDNDKNETRDPERPIIPFDGYYAGAVTSLYCMKYDPSGKETKSVAVHITKNDELMCVQQMMRVGNNHLLGFAGRKKESKLCKIKVN
ncbi:MAG TPA: hypothetical protein VGO45_05800 [Bacteroidia bacterium]|jgi:hypothetical protein|nr:hypothetical protein [Bacteroidia bacterium]